ncbi:MAG: hypothetical protein NTX25_13645 [Proteobacteria bacterium]|nr:hypothetical protein [Pseudomonadota bacterium]
MLAYRSRALAALMILACLGLSACRLVRSGMGSILSGVQDNSISTTYYPADGDYSMGPGHFSCSQYNWVNQWYVAPSDTFGDPKLWEGPTCPGRAYDADCASVQKTCGRKVKLRCRENCKPNAPEVVAMVTDFCPRDHPQNKKSGACQGGPHFDIGKPIWELMRSANDNIKVSYQVVDDATALGPINEGSGGPTAPPAAILESGSGSLTCMGNKFCSNGWGWLQSGESGCSSASAGWKGNGCSCSCSANNNASNSNQQTPTPTTAPQGNGTYPSCIGNKFCSNGWGWLQSGENGCSSGSAGWKGNGCSCSCSANNNAGNSNQQAPTPSPAPAGNGAYPSCIGNKFCSNGWGWLQSGENGCSSGSAGWKGNGCSCSCSANATSQAPESSSAYLRCAGNQYCSGGWGWLNSGQNGCSSASYGWKGNGCSCVCN